MKDRIEEVSASIELGKLDKAKELLDEGKDIIDSRNRIFVSCCDATNFLQIAVPQDFITTLRTSIPKNRTVRIQNFFYAGGKIYLNGFKCNEGAKQRPRR